MKKRKLILPGLILMSALAVLAPSARADGGQGGGDDGPKQPRWPPIRANVEEVQTSERVQPSDEGFSLQSMWDYLHSWFV
ncbi:MAG: hypothetical protein H0T92_06970 [Pyrinomonadaceae bacterium]|nr:hypothetical protein [Pyrinomonadaceae bacterium]